MSQNRPISAANSKLRQPKLQSKPGSFKRKRRPITAKTRVQDNKPKLHDSLANPFGSPENEETLFMLEEQPHDESGVVDSSKAQESKVFEIPEAQRKIKKDKPISPIFGHSNRFKRPQSAKNAFKTLNTYGINKGDSHDYATIELKKIFENSKGLNILANSESESKFSKPPIGSRGKNKLKKRPVLKKYDNYESIMELHKSEFEPTTTLTSLPSNKIFDFTSRMSSKMGKRRLRFVGDRKKIRAISQHKRVG
eukprot:CAMPEP_0197015456 /NCGR_PEP_ID=MMETSP1380-20130617/74254_1 /TAXON_ID=5936 /ORGANISM="Euplotes crassus, Strain CT5" /LENGTH=251 /DNA_ID=CAMNT_0042441373 /DNA_START=310 /DNA_END=1066 /DNA_ORIENTATION=+